MTTPNGTKQRREEQCVARWRFSRLRRAGYGPHAAAELARRSDVDLHLAVSQNGCHVDTALVILL